MRLEKYRPRLIIAALAGCLLMLLLPSEWRASTRLLVAWDTSIALYLVIVFRMIFRSTNSMIKKRAALQDERAFTILLLITLSAAASIVANVMELSAAKAQTGHIQLTLVGLTALTVILSWSFLHTEFALHYAHDFYNDRGGVGGLDFPAEKQPDYWDFVYYAFIIGTAAATADVNITSRGIRKVTTVHCILAFFFNTTILGLTVNIAAGLF